MGKNKFVIISVVSLFVLIIGAMIVGLLFSNNKDLPTNNVVNVVNNSVAVEEDDESNINAENIDYDANAKKQMAMPEKGETIAILHVKNYGEIVMKFFKESAPMAVQNFLVNAQNGYYDGITFHRVVENFVIQSGDPTGTGTGGESLWEDGFSEEISNKILPYRGAVGMASKQPNTNTLGSQFFIVQTSYSEEYEELLETYKYPEGIIKNFKTYGGSILSLYGLYTMFGQVIEGMDIVDKIAKVAVDENGKPKKDIILEKVEVKTYGEE